MKKISVIGLGYVGLPTAVIAAQSGYDVAGFDIDLNKIEKIKNGDPTIVEPEIQERLNSVLFSEKLKISNQLEVADCFLITVPTPLKDDKKADMSHVFDAGRQIAQVLKPGDLVILESTVSVGTTDKLAKLLEEISGLTLGINFYVAYCPERILPGNTFKELVENDRIIGAPCLSAAEFARKFYSKFVKGNLEITDDKTAEMVKLIENSFRDTQIAFANQVADMSEIAGIDPYNVIFLANKHPRVNILNPTCGVGGHCIAVDPWFLIDSFSEQTKLLKVVRSINDEKPNFIVNKVLNVVENFKKQNFRNPVIAVFGVTYKPDVDDIRESPALKIVKELNSDKKNLNLIAYDPFVVKKVFDDNNIANLTNQRNLLEKADIVLFLVKHTQFFNIKTNLLQNKNIIDACGFIYDFNKKNNNKNSLNIIKESNILKEVSF
ncbi:MAG: nucleotide sugar dehydrogenase [bacterium]